LPFCCSHCSPPGPPETDVSPEHVYQLINLLLSEDLLYLLAINIHKIPFEARKDTQFIFSNAFRYKNPDAAEPLALHYVLSSRPQVITALCHGYERRESAMPCGGVLREALKYDAITALVLYDEPTPDGKPRNLAEVDTTASSSGQGVFWKFFDWIVKSSFEVCADAFGTFRVSDGRTSHLILPRLEYFHGSWLILRTAGDFD
jgi:calcium binding protein 39